MFFCDISLDKTYYIRVDSDYFFLVVRPYFSKVLYTLDCDYGYLIVTEQEEDKVVSLVFGKSF